MTRVLLPLGLVLLMAGCGTDPADGADATDSTDGTDVAAAVEASTSGGSTDDADTATTPDASSTSTTASTVASADSTGTTEPSQPSSSTTSSAATTADAEVRCRPVADLEAADELTRWQVVNDGVMGGRSSAEAGVVDGVLTLEGDIVTDGGGFSSVRLALAEPLGESSGLQLRLRTDGRAYELTLADAAPGRDRRVSHQAPIEVAGEASWGEVVVDFADLDASVFGRPVEVDPFDPTAAVEVGIILADGADGPFRLELDWIRVCP
ncbi:MAG: CIA30 family protein [Actinomycetota bacterium]